MFLPLFFFFFKRGLRVCTHSNNWGCERNPTDSQLADSVWSYKGDGIQSDWPHFVATGKSTCTGSLSLCVVCVTAILLPPLHVSCGINGRLGGVVEGRESANYGTHTHQCEISPIGRLTNQWRNSLGQRRAEHAGLLFLTLPRTPLKEKSFWFQNSIFKCQRCR